LGKNNSIRLPAAVVFIISNLFASVVIAQTINLSRPNYRVPDNLTFYYQGAEYDSYYKHHWRITRMNGYFVTSFEDPSDVIFHALGSTIEGVSHCQINVYVNGNKFWNNKFIDKNWNNYFIPASAFSRGGNTLKIELTGRSHIWIDQISVNRKEREYRTQPRDSYQNNYPSKKQRHYYHSKGKKESMR